MFSHHWGLLFAQEQLVDPAMNNEKNTVHVSLNMPEYKACLNMSFISFYK